MFLKLIHKKWSKVLSLTDKDKNKHFEITLISVTFSYLCYQENVLAFGGNYFRTDCLPEASDIDLCWSDTYFKFEY